MPFRKKKLFLLVSLVISTFVAGRVLSQPADSSKQIIKARDKKNVDAYLEKALLWQQAVLNDDKESIARLEKVVKNMPYSVELELKKLCIQKKNANACAVLGWKYAINLDPSAHDYLDKACEYGHGVSCEIQGISYFHLCIKAPWCKKAERFLKKACDKNFRDACYRLGLMYTSGCRGVKKDEKLGKSYLKKACILGHKGACKALEPSWKRFFHVLLGKENDKENVK